jgi:hypothetical protein
MGVKRQYVELLRGKPSPFAETVFVAAAVESHGSAAEMLIERQCW